MHICRKQEYNTCILKLFHQALDSRVLTHYNFLLHWPGEKRLEGMMMRSICQGCWKEEYNTCVLILFPTRLPGTSSLTRRHWPESDDTDSISVVCLSFNRYSTWLNYHFTKQHLSRTEYGTTWLRRTNWASHLFWSLVTHVERSLGQGLSLM